MMQAHSVRLALVTAGLAVSGVLALSACTARSGGDRTPGAGGTDYSHLSGSLAVDGSSTVGPITEAIAEEFLRESDVKVAVGISGTGGGFERFCKGETDINDASRPIKDAEREACASSGVDFVEFKVGVDGLTVVVNPKNDFVECLTWSQLRRIWDQGSTVETWSNVDTGFPNETIDLYGPGTDSGTFDYFTEEINGKAKQSRADYTASEDDNTLVKGVENDEHALGYFGYAYFQEAGDALRAVEIDKDQDSKGTPVPADKRRGCVGPTDETINDGSYSLSRPLFIYVSKKSIAKPEVKGFVQFYLENASWLVEDVGYLPLSDAEYQQGLDTLKRS